MTPAEAKKLRVGERVKWESSDEFGRVVEKDGGPGIRVRWDDGTDAIYLFEETSRGLLHVQRAS